MKLKPCPFCGGPAKCYRAHHFVFFIIECESCRAKARLYPAESKDEAIATWNRRAIDEKKVSALFAKRRTAREKLMNPNRRKP